MSYKELLRMTMYHKVLLRKTPSYKVVTPNNKVLPSTATYYKELQCTTKNAVLSSTTKYSLKYYSVPQSSTIYYKVLLYKELLRTTTSYKVLLRMTTYYSVLLRTIAYCKTKFKFDSRHT